MNKITFNQQDLPGGWQVAVWQARRWLRGHIRLLSVSRRFGFYPDPDNILNCSWKTDDLDEMHALLLRDL